MFTCPLFLPLFTLMTLQKHVHVKSMNTAILCILITKSTYKSISKNSVNGELTNILGFRVKKAVTPCCHMYKLFRFKEIISGHGTAHYSVLHTVTFLEAYFEGKNRLIFLLSVIGANLRVLHSVNGPKSAEIQDLRRIRYEELLHLWRISAC